MELDSLLFRLCMVPGASGREDAVADWIAEHVPHDGRLRRDALGNVLYTEEGLGPHILLDAHIDQIGLVVTAIDEKGYLKVDKCGGMDARILAGHAVTVWGREPLFGVVSCMPPHLSTGKDRQKVPDVSEMAVDIGRDATAACALVRPGDRVTLDLQPAHLLHGCVTAPALDDRAGAAVLLRCLELIRDQKHCTVTAAFTVQEEVGTRGAGSAAFGMETDEAIAVDVSFAATPDSPPHKCGELGKGPMIGISPTLSPDVTEELEHLAKEKNIPYQLEVMGGETGTNADVIDISGVGRRTGLVSIPLRYMHTGIEIVSTDDVEQTARLLAAYLCEKGRERT